MLGEGPASTEVLQAPGVFMMQKGQFRQCTLKGGEVGKATFGAKGSSDSARRNHECSQPKRNSMLSTDHPAAGQRSSPCKRLAQRHT